MVYCYFRLPEPTGRYVALVIGSRRKPQLTCRTFAEIDLLFERKVPARAFSKTKVDAFDHSVANLLAPEGDAEVKDAKRTQEVA